MATTHQRLTSNRQINELTVSTPLFDNESITSWLIRASLNQGCDPCVFIHHFWAEYKLWNTDFDKGFNAVSPIIHNEMAILANTPTHKFNQQNTMSFAKITDNFKANQRVGWVMPIVRASGRKSATGYFYCPDCFNEDKQSHLSLDWRFSWVVYCDKHHTPLQNACGHCGKAYQPQLLKAQNRFINHCHYCNNKLNKQINDKPFHSNSYELQKLAKQTWQSNQGMILGQITDAKNWFGTLDFLVALLRKGALNQNNVHKKLLHYFGVLSQAIPFYTPKTGLHFDYLDYDDRVMLMYHAKILQAIDFNKWIEACYQLAISKNAFDILLGDKNNIPTPILTIYNQLPTFNKARSENKIQEIKPKSISNVLRSWERLQRKIKLQNEVA